MVLKMLAVWKDNISVGDCQKRIVTGIAIHHIGQTQARRLMQKTLNSSAIH
jgi:hypothetical protein